MTGWFAIAVWALGASLMHVRERRRLVLAARAGHEIRGPLSAARLALDGLERTARVEAIDLELRRAALALDDLAGPGGAAASAGTGSPSMLAPSCARRRPRGTRSRPHTTAGCP